MDGAHFTASAAGRRVTPLLRRSLKGLSSLTALVTVDIGAMQYRVVTYTVECRPGRIYEHSLHELGVQMKAKRRKPAAARV